MLFDVLRNIGLTEYETKIYISSLELGKATAGEILQKANLTSGKIYEILNVLKNKGFISEVVEAGVRKFSPADPSLIKNYLNEKKVNIEKQEKDFGTILPDILSKINTKKEDVKVDVFYGIKGLRAAYAKEMSYYKENKNLYVMGIMEGEFYPEEVYNFFISTLYPARKKAKIVAKKIFSITAKNKKDRVEKDSKVRYINYNSPVSVLVIGELTLIGIHSKGALIQISIESEEVAKSFIQQFELMWKIAKP